MGSVVAMVGLDGQVKGRTNYGPYGQITSQSGIQPDFAYAGLYRHQHSGLYLATFRAYNPAIGRWLNRDPIKEAGGINLYGYVMGNPVGYVDPLGLRPPKYVPPSANVSQNVAEARNMTYIEWYNAVRNGGKWDYKQQGQKYEEFGNYNYGATARAVGILGNIPLRGAGWAQEQAGTSLPKWGSWWDWPPSNFGDDPADQYWITQGMLDYEKGNLETVMCYK